MVDLDGAFVDINGLVTRFADPQGYENPVQLGGGIRTLEHIENWLVARLRRVNLGTIAVHQCSPMKLKSFGQVVGIDAKGGKVAVSVGEFPNSASSNSRKSSRPCCRSLHDIDRDGIPLASTGPRRRTGDAVPFRSPWPAGLRLDRRHRCTALARRPQAEGAIPPAAPLRDGRSILESEALDLGQGRTGKEISTTLKASVIPRSRRSRRRPCRRRASISSIWDAGGSRQAAEAYDAAGADEPASTLPMASFRWDNRDDLRCREHGRAVLLPLIKLGGGATIAEDSVLPLCAQTRRRSPGCGHQLDFRG